MRPSLQALMKKLKRKNVFIIGGGMSVLNVDLSLLQDEVVVCINDAYRDFPNATAIYWVDESWASENYDNLKQHACQLRFTSKHTQHLNYKRRPDPTTIANGFVLRRTGDAGYDPNADCVMGNNGGVQVLNLVVNMRPSNVILIGYDMKKEGNRSHYHNEERPFIKDQIYSDQFIPSIMALSREMKKSGCKVNIINANPNSAVRCFEFGEYTDFLKH